MTGTEACRRWLEEWLDRQPAGSRLPAQDQLCRRFAIGKRALRSIIADLHAAGRLQIRPQAGTWSTGPRPCEAATAGPPTDRASRVAEALASDIQRLALPDHTALPPIRWLAKQYRCGTNTMTRALHRLLERHVVEQQGRRYRRAAHQRQRRLLLVHRADRPDPILQILEAEAAVAGHPVWACSPGQLSQLLQEACRADHRSPHIIAVLPNIPVPAAVTAIGKDPRFGRGPHQARMVYFGSIRQPLPNAIRCAVGSRRTQIARTIATHVQARDSHRLVLYGTASPGKDAQFHLCLAIAVECLRLRPGLGLRILLETPANTTLDQLMNDPGWLQSVLLADSPVRLADLPDMVTCSERIDQARIGEDCDLLVLSQPLPGWHTSDRHRRPTLCAFESPWARRHRLTGVGENLPYLASLLLRACNDPSDLPLTSRGFLRLPLTMIDREDG